ncbi:IS630 family transposase [Microbulbifer sp. SSSA002]|uniref:IS630 family transposase n=1 Tax=unclassified Microbulbifer TaxID=2619833 RepID=UPI004039138D
MKKEDARTLSASAKEEKRKQAIRLRKNGYSYKRIADLVGVHFETIGKWYRAYLAHGTQGISAKTLGRKPGTGRLLSEEQEKAIKQLIIDKRPDQMKLTYALWTRQAVQLLIKQEFNIKIAVRTVGDLLARWGFTPQKPLRRAYEQCPTRVESWLEVEYPRILKKAKKEKAEIYWGDETGVRSDCQYGRGYALKGRTPVIQLNTKRVSCNMISAITNQGKVRFQIYDGSMNADRLIEFMRRLTKDAKRKVILILDNLRVHHAKVVKAWLKDQVDQIEVFYLPPYSPELNPDEYLNCDLKVGVRSTSPARNAKQFKKKIISHMWILQKTPKRVAAYFKHKKINYAAQ